MKVEVLENNKRKLTFEVSTNEFEEAIKYSYNKNKSHINMAGFRRGKAPRKLIEAQYGPEVFYDDAIDYILPKAYKAAMNEAGLEAVSRPELTGFNVLPDKSVVFDIEMYVKPEITLGEYKGLKYTKASTEPTEAEIMAQIEDALEKNSREVSITDRPIAVGDIVTIDFTGYLDGEPFENGAGTDYQLTIGSHTFIGDFEDQLVGHEIGENVMVKVRFPDNYHADDLSGKDAEFSVRINEIKIRELPELDDDFASDVSEYDTLAEYKESISNKIKETKINNAEYDRETQLVRQLVSNSEMNVPEIMIENQIDARIHEFMYKINSRGTDFDTYLNYIGQTKETFRESFRAISTETVNSNLVLEALAKSESLEADETEIDERINMLKGANDPEIDLDELRKDIAEDLKLRKALDFLIENAVVSEDEPPIDEQPQEVLA